MRPQRKPSRDRGPTASGATVSYLEQRIRLEKFELKQLPKARCAGRVVLAWETAEEFVGSAEGPSSPRGELRCAAEAAARALERAAQDRVTLEVHAVKAIETFDAIIVVVRLQSEMGDLAERLVGSCLIKQHPTRGAVLAVLNATNRLFGKLLQGARSSH